MPNHVDLRPHLALFLTDFPADPQSAIARGASLGLDNTDSCEMSAWCWEISLQLQELAKGRALPLAMMGGAPTQLRVGLRQQRGSRDGDFLVAGGESDIAGLMAAFAQRFAALPPRYFRPEMQAKLPADAQELEMVTYFIRVPSLLLHGAGGGSGDQTVKMEFHFRTPLPPTEEITAEVIALTKPITVKTVRLEHQLALKFMPLADPPIGAVLARDGDLPKQFNDLDEMLGLGPLHWSELSDAFDATVAFECLEKRVSVSRADVLAQIETRLSRWLAGARDFTIADRPYFALIQAFQSAQVAQGARMSKIGWRARLARITYLSRCLRNAATGEADWARAYEDWFAMRASPFTGAITNPEANAANLLAIGVRWMDQRGGKLPGPFNGRPAECALWELLGT